MPGNPATATPFRVSTKSAVLTEPTPAPTGNDPLSTDSVTDDTLVVRSSPLVTPTNAPLDAVVPVWLTTKTDVVIGAFVIAPLATLPALSTGRFAIVAAVGDGNPTEIVGAEVYPDPGLVTVKPVSTPPAFTVAVAAALIPPPPEIVTVGGLVEEYPVPATPRLMKFSWPFNVPLPLVVNGSKPPPDVAASWKSFAVGLMTK